MVMNLYFFDKNFVDSLKFSKWKHPLRENKMNEKSMVQTEENRIIILLAYNPQGYRSKNQSKM